MRARAPGPARVPAAAGGPQQPVAARGSCGGTAAAAGVVGAGALTAAAAAGAAAGRRLGRSGRAAWSRRRSSRGRSSRSWGGRRGRGLRCARRGWCGSCRRRGCRGDRERRRCRRRGRRWPVRTGRRCLGRCRRGCCRTGRCRDRRGRGHRRRRRWERCDRLRSGRAWPGAPGHHVVVRARATGCGPGPHDEQPRRPARPSPRSRQVPATTATTHVGGRQHGAAVTRRRPRRRARRRPRPTAPPTGSPSPAPLPSPTPTPTAVLTLTYTPLGDLVQGRPGWSGSGWPTPAMPRPAPVTATVTLPPGVRFVGLQRAAWRSHGSPAQTPEIMDVARPDGWTCSATDAGATCTRTPSGRRPPPQAYLRVDRGRRLGRATTPVTIAVSADGHRPDHGHRRARRPGRGPVRALRRDREPARSSRSATRCCPARRPARAAPMPAAQGQPSTTTTGRMAPFNDADDDADEGLRPPSR